MAWRRRRELNGSYGVMIPGPEGDSGAKGDPGDDGADGLLIRGITLVSGATHNLEPSHSGYHLRYTNVGGCTVTVNTDAAWQAGDRVRITAAGGDVVLVEGTATLNSRDGALTSAGQFAVFEVEYVGGGEFDVMGDLVV